MVNFKKHVLKTWLSFSLTLVLAFGTISFAGFEGGGSGFDSAPIASAASEAWDGESYDTSWYGDGTADVYAISDANDLAGLAKIVNNYADTAYSASGIQYAAEGQRAGNVAKYGKKEGYYKVPSDDFYGKKIILTSDIDLGGTTTAAYNTDAFSPAAYEGPQWEEIGRSAGTHGAPGGWAFNGVFDGNYHTVNGLISKNETISGDNDATENYKSLFGNIGTMSLVKNLIVDNGYVSGDRGVGGVVARCWGTVENCANLGVTIKSNGYRGAGGGVVGQIYDGNGKGESAAFGTHVSGCINKAAVRATQNDNSVRGPGGVVAEIERPVYNSYNAGDVVSATASRNGSVLGEMRSKVDIYNLFGVTSAAVNMLNLIGNNAGNVNNPATSNSALKTLAEMTGAAVLAALNSNVVPSFPAITSTDAAAKALLLKERVAPSFATITGAPYNGLPGLNIAARPSPKTVTLDANGGTVNGKAFVGLSVVYGGTYNLPTPIRKYYAFGGWFTAKSGGTRMVASAVYNFKQNLALYARWTPKKFTVTFDANGGKIGKKSKVSVTRAYNTAVGKLGTPKRTYKKTVKKNGKKVKKTMNYKFLGWYKAKGGKAKVSAGTKVTKAVTYYAHWKK